MVTEVNDLLRRVLVEGESYARYCEEAGLTSPGPAGYPTFKEAHAYLDGLEQEPRIQPDANWIAEASRMLDRLDSLEARMDGCVLNHADDMRQVAERVEHIETVLRNLHRRLGAAEAFQASLLGNEIREFSKDVKARVERTEKVLRRVIGLKFAHYPARELLEELDGALAQPSNTQEETRE